MSVVVVTRGCSGSELGEADAGIVELLEHTPVVVCDTKETVGTFGPASAIRMQRRHCLRIARALSAYRIKRVRLSTYFASRNDFPREVPEHAWKYRFTRRRAS